MSLSKFLEVELPIIQAPMAGVQDSNLALAVSKAGGLGSLPCAMLSYEKLIEEVDTINSETSKPINFNFFCHTPPTPNVKRENQWRAELQHYFSEFGINEKEIPESASRLPFNQNHIEILERYQPAVISFHFGLPEKKLLNKVKSWGTKILSSATTVKEAQWLEAQGADGIIAQGLEAGGHRGVFLSKDLSTQAGTFALLPQVLKQVNIPVIAAGGIADGKGVSAAIFMGATAVQIGTSYLLCHESLTTELH